MSSPTCSADPDLPPVSGMLPSGYSTGILTSSFSALVLSAISVLIAPGQITFTRILSGPSSTASILARDLPRLAAGVGRRSGIGEHPGAVHRGGDDHRAASASQMRNRALDGGEGSDQVDIQGGTEFLHGKLLDTGPSAIDAGIGHHHIEPSPGLHRGGNR